MGFLRRTFDQALEKIRQKGEVPLAVLAYSVEEDKFHLYQLDNTSPEELNALLEKIGIYYEVTGYEDCDRDESERPGPAG
jgi:hypothetical protein